MAEENLKDAIPKILRDKPYRINIVHSTQEEEEVSARIDSRTVREIKNSIDEILSTIPNNGLWKDIYKHHIKVNGRNKQSLVNFYDQIVDYNDQLCNVPFENNDNCIDS